MSDFSDYIFYADESGDHSLVRIDATYPVFVLCLCGFNKSYYLRRIVPAIQSLKFKWFGHDSAILHERDIRKKRPPFEFLNNPDLNEQFLRDINRILHDAKMSIIASVIDKLSLKIEYLFQDNPYHVALGFCIEKAFEFLKKKSQADKVVHFIFERRGDREDKDLELEFRRITDGQNRFLERLPNFEIKFVDKKANAPGMQLADLTARPVGLKILRPNQANRAFETIEHKLIKPSGSGRATGRIRVFP